VSHQKKKETHHYDTEDIHAKNKRDTAIKAGVGIHPNRQIAKSCLLSLATIADYMARVQAAGLTWPLPLEMDENAIENLCFLAPR
jgi:hypothetical protein